MRAYRLNQWRFPLPAMLSLALATCAYAAPVQGSASPSPLAPVIEAMRTHDFATALALLRVDLAKTPGDKRLWALRGMAFSGQGNARAAVGAFDHALALDPAYLPALEGAAQLQFQHDPPASKKYLLGILATHPDDATSHAMLGYVEYRARDCHAAVTNFAQAAVAIANQPSALGAYGYCLASLERYAESAQVLQQALTATPDSSDPQSDLANDLRIDLAIDQWKTSHPQDALATLQPLIDGTTPSTAAQLLASSIDESANDTASAVALLRKVILEEPKNVTAYLDFAALAFDHASMQIGIDYLDAGLTQLPREPRLYLARGVLRAASGHFQEAADDFAEANTLDPHLSYPEVAQGLVASQEYHSAEALDRFRTAARARPNDALTQYLLAEALSQEGQKSGTPVYAEEIRAARQAARLDPSMVAAHDLLATIYLQNNQAADVVTECRAALATDPKDQQAIYHLILALRKTGGSQEIPSLLQRLNTLRDTSASAQASPKRFRLEEVPQLSPP